MDCHCHAVPKRAEYANFNVLLQGSGVSNNVTKLESVNCSVSVEARGEQEDGAQWAVLGFHKATVVSAP
jgi:hypothetical protein